MEKDIGRSKKREGKKIKGEMAGILISRGCQCSLSQLGFWI